MKHTMETDALDRIGERLAMSGAKDAYIERDLSVVRLAIQQRTGDGPALKSALLRLTVTALEYYMGGEDGRFVESHLDNMLTVAGVTVLDAEDKRRVIAVYRRLKT